MKRQKRQSTSKRSSKQKNLTCYFTQTGTTPDYKEVLTLKRFTSERNKILPQKYSGLTSKNQRLLAKEIKKARYMALLPYTDTHAV
jgi:small subunit ribosomal protein S18